MEKQAYLEMVKEVAEDYFRSGTYYCSEAVVETINDVLGKPYDDDVVRLASGFPIGMGQAQCLCGAVSGGQIALGMVYGRKKGEPMDPQMFELAKGLHDYIKEGYRSVCCRIITRQWQGDDFKSEGRKQHCIEITGKVAVWVVERLIEAGKIDPATAPVITTGNQAS
ncbi:C-GCAxxG-C-C family protein [Vagococcus acidifermentans]|nr:C-GCAxxG-C-C family protein [Vagococcus acidifermentans]